MEEIKKIMVFGTFDVLHEGHLHLFREAKKYGNFLIAVIARDETVLKVKGRLPEQKQKERLRQVSKIEYVDKVCLGYSDDKYKVIKKFRPDIIVFGYDQFVFTQTIPKLLIDLKLDTKIIRLDSFKPEIFKSSLIKSKNAK